MNINYRKMLKDFIPPIIFYRYRNLSKRLQQTHKKVYRLSSGDVYWTGKRVGGLWDEIGQLQFNFLVQNGLEPYHKFLDIGCGSLRGGVHFIKYLNNGNYYGVDRQKWLLDAAIEVELPRYGVSYKDVNLLCRDDFDFSLFGVEFDYALAQSVFTHITWNSILRCLVNVQKCLKKEGRFFSTFFEDKIGKHRISSISHIPGGKTTYPDKDPFHYEFNVLVELARRAALKVDYIGDWNHPKNQMMMVFSKL